MPLIAILAQAPWGPVRLQPAESMGELLRHLEATGGQAPAHIEDVGDRDPGEVMRAALVRLPPGAGAGWIPVRVDGAARIVAEAASAISARVVAGKGGRAAPGKPEGRRESIGP